MVLGLHLLPLVLVKGPLLDLHVLVRAALLAIVLASRRPSR